MGKYLEYVGPSHYRVLSAEDLATLSPNHEPRRLAGLSAKVMHQDRSTMSVGEFSEEVAAYLMANEPTEWREVDQARFEENKKETGQAGAQATAATLAEEETEAAKTQADLGEAVGDQATDTLGSQGSPGPTAAGVGQQVSDVPAAGESSRRSGRAR